MTATTSRDGTPVATVVIVMFNSASTVAECLGSVPRDCEVIVVDQRSSDASVEVALRCRPDARLIKAGTNRGFGAGCNLGAANATSDVLIFLNPDASFETADSVKIMCDSVKRNNAVVGPRILDAHGNDETRARHWSRSWSDIAEIFMPTALKIGALRRDISREDPVYMYGGRVPYVQGACMAIRTDDFWRVGGFDERFYLYHEEEALARKLLTVGVVMVLETRAVIIHIGGRSTGQFRDFSAGQYYRSVALSYLLFRKRLVAISTIAALWATLRLMAAATPVRERIGLRADIGRSWYRSAAAGVASGYRLQMVDPPKA